MDGGLHLGCFPETFEVASGTQDIPRGFGRTKRRAMRDDSEILHQAVEGRTNKKMMGSSPNLNWFAGFWPKVPQTFPNLFPQNDGMKKIPVGSP